MVQSMQSWHTAYREYSKMVVLMKIIFIFPRPVTMTEFRKASR